MGGEFELARVVLVVVVVGSVSVATGAVVVGGVVVVGGGIVVVDEVDDVVGAVVGGGPVVVVLAATFAACWVAGTGASVVVGLSLPPEHATARIANASVVAADRTLGILARVRSCGNG